MQEKIDIAREIYDHLKRYAGVLFWIGMGIGAKLATINKDKRITKAQALATIFTGVFCGFVASTVCSYYSVNEKLVWAIVSVSALSGENITAWIFVNAKDILTQIVKIFIKKK